MARPDNLKNSPLEPVVGIIAEYNPFHNGHAYHIQEAKLHSNAKYCIVVMSGDFVQRGSPAIFDKYIRTHMALLGGADLVLEIPPAFATSSAEDFAACGVALLDRLGIVTHLCFGSECGDSKILNELAQILSEEPEDFSQYLKEFVSNGFSYPQARELALSCYLQSHSKSKLTHQVSHLLSSPNNTLGIEYCKAILKRKSTMVPITICRTGNHYHDKELSNNYSSATAIRKVIIDLKSAHNRSPVWTEALENQVPFACLEWLRKTTPLTANDFSSLLSYRLLELSHQGIELEKFADVSSELASRIEKQLLNFSSFENRISSLKTRQYTYTRISRCLTHILLQITRGDIIDRKKTDYVSYIRVLGFRKDSALLLKEIKRASKLPIISKTADAPYILSPSSLVHFQQDLFCSHIYQTVLEQKSHIMPKNEYTQSVILI